MDFEDVRFSFYIIVLAILFFVSAKIGDFGILILACGFFVILEIQQVTREIKMEIKKYHKSYRK